MLDIAFKDLTSKKGRTGMVIVGVMTCVLLIGVISFLTYEIGETIQIDANSITGKLVFETNGTGYPPSGSNIPENVSNHVLANSVVNPDKSSAIILAALPHNNTANTFLLGLTPGSEQAFINSIKVTGSDSLVGQSNNSVILGYQAAKDYNVTVGGTFTVKNQQFNVIGVLAKQGIGTTSIQDESVIAALPFVQKISQRPGLVTADIITPNNGVSLENAQNTLENNYDNNTYTVYTQKEALQSLNSTQSGTYLFLDMVIAMVFLVSAILIMVVMMMTVKEKTREIGTMRALGTSKRRILSLIFYESLIISIIGGIVGILLIIPLYDLFIYVAGNGQLGYIYSIPLSILIEIAVVVLLIGTLSGLIPAYLATRISPIEALRYE
jgi:putative ABC transport system permease protein